MKFFRLVNKVFVVSTAMVLIAQSVSAAIAYVPVRISIKFILDKNGNRPLIGNLNTDVEINADVNAGNTILGENISEFRLEFLELVDLAGVSQWYTADATGTNWDNLRTAATNNPSTYRWRNDAVNIYITAGAKGGISNFPPNNRMILMNQW